MPVAGSTHFVTLPLARATTLVSHQRSVPSSVASCGNDYASVPPAAPSTGTDRSCRPLGAHIRSIVDEVASPLSTEWRRAFAPRFYGFARAVKVRASLLPLRFHLDCSALRHEGWRLRLTLAKTSLPGSDAPLN